MGMIKDHFLGFVDFFLWIWLCSLWNILVVLYLKWLKWMSLIWLFGWFGGWETIVYFRF